MKKNKFIIFYILIIIGLIQFGNSYYHFRIKYKSSYMNDEIKDKQSNSNKKETNVKNINNTLKSYEKFLDGVLIVIISLVVIFISIMLKIIYKPNKQ